MDKRGEGSIAIASTPLDYKVIIRYGSMYGSKAFQ